MKRTLAAALLLSAFLSAPALAAAPDKPDDSVTMSLSAENWVTTQSARIVFNVEAAVSEENAGAMRANMAKALDNVIKADWRLVNFSRSQDQTGLERWSAQYETRLPEGDLNNLAEKAKKNSRAGMQISVAEIEFTPTLEERQAAMSQIRTQLYKRAEEELEILNKSLAGRHYRIAAIDFADGGFMPPMAKMARPMMALARASGGAMESDAGLPSEKSEKINVTARVTFAATEPEANDKADKE